MSRSHHNTHSQQQNHQNHHQNSWFMSPNLVNNLFCSPGNIASANCNSAFLNSSSINNHLTNFLSTQHHFLPQNPINNQSQPNVSQSQFSANGSFSSHYHGGQQNFTSQPYSPIFPPNNPLSNSTNIGSNGRLVIGQNNHHFQTSSNHSKSMHSNKISRVNMNLNSTNGDIYQFHKNQSGYGSNGLILSSSGSNLHNKSSSDFSEKSLNHVQCNKDSKLPNNNIFNQPARQNAWPSNQNQEIDISMISTKKAVDKNLSEKCQNKHQSVKGMENIKLDNEVVHTNYSQLTAGFPTQSSLSAKSFESPDDSHVTDKCGTSNSSSEYFITNSNPLELEDKCHDGTLKFTQPTLSVDEDELIFADSGVVKSVRPDSNNSEKCRKKTFNEYRGNNPKSSEKFEGDVDSLEAFENGIEIENNVECDNIVKKKQGDKNNSQHSDGQCIPARFLGSCTHNCIHTSLCTNMDLSNNDKNFMWQSQNQMSLVNFGANQQAAMVNSYPSNGAHFSTNGLMESVGPSNISSYISSPQQTASNFAVNCPHLTNHNNNVMTAAYLASSLNGTHPSVISNLSHKCNIYRQDNTFTAAYHDVSSGKLWQYYITNRQTEAMYVRKVQLRNALHMVMSYVFENAGLFIVGSSMNGFGNDNSDMDLCLTITSKDLHQKKEAFVVLNQLVEPLRKCSFIKNLQLIRATVPILKFRDTLAGVDCDLNINNVVGIYNTHLLAMYNRIDWRLRPLGMYIKHWAQKVDLHDASRGRLSTYTLILMVIQYLQAGCKPPVLPCLQAAFPKQFSYDRQVKEVDMRLELPWDELRSSNTSKLSDLLMGFFEYYVDKFDFARMAVSIRSGKPLPIEMAIKQLPPHEQLQNVKSFKLFIEEPFSLTNVARSLFDGLVFLRIKRCFRHSLQVMRLKQSLKMMFTLPTQIGNTPSNNDDHEPCQSISNESETTSNYNQDDNSKTLPLSDSNDNDNSEKSDMSCLDDGNLISNKSEEITTNENYNLDANDALLNFGNN